MLVELEWGSAGEVYDGICAFLGRCGESECVPGLRSRLVGNGFA